MLRWQHRFGVSRMLAPRWRPARAAPPCKRGRLYPVRGVGGSVSRSGSAGRGRSTQPVARGNSIRPSGLNADDRKDVARDWQSGGRVGSLRQAQGQVRGRGNIAREQPRSGSKSGSRSSSSSTGRSRRSDDPTDMSTVPHLPDLAARVGEYAADWSRAGDIATLRAAFSRVGKLSSERGADPTLARSIIKTLAVAYQPLVPGLRDAKSCVIPLWACAKLGYWEGGLAEALLGRLEEGGLMQAAKGQDHSLLWWAVSEAPEGLRDMAVVVLGGSGTCLLRMTGEQLDSQGWSNVLLACARLQWGDDPTLLHHVTACLAAHPRPDHQHLANAIYSLGELAEDCRHQPRHEDLQLLVEQVVVRLGRQQRFKPQGLSNMLLGCAKLQYQHAALLRALVKGPGVYAAVVAAAMQPGAMAGAKSQEWSNLLYGLALARHRPGRRFMEVMAAEGALETLRTTATSQACANLMWSLAVLGMYEQRLLDVLLERLGELLQRDRGQLTEQELANSLWALSVMGPYVLRRHSGLVEGLLQEVVRRWAMQGSLLRGTMPPSKVEHLCQLWQVQLELEHMDGDVGLRSIFQDAGGGSLLAAAQEARLESNRDTSRMERQVAGALEQLRGRLAERQGDSGAIKSIHPEYPVEGVCGRVDVVVEMADGRLLAVEVDGPWHFLANHPHTKTGRTQLRDRQLERVFGPGNVVSVPYWEWNELDSDKQREEYLCGLLGLKLGAGA